MLDGRLLGAYCLSEPESGSDAARSRPARSCEGDAYVVTGTRRGSRTAVWPTSTTSWSAPSDDGPRGITCLLAEASTPGLSAAEPERKMAAKRLAHRADPAGRRRVPAERRIGDEGQGF